MNSQDNLRNQQQSGNQHQDQSSSNQQSSERSQGLGTERQETSTQQQDTGRSGQQSSERSGMQGSEQSSSSQELDRSQMQDVNGGGLLDDLNITNVAQGYIQTSSTDEDGRTESDKLDFGLGSNSMFDNK